MEQERGRVSSLVKNDQRLNLKCGKGLERRELIQEIDMS